MTKIYCWINSGKGSTFQCVCAMDENGSDAGSHLSSSEEWAKHDIGYSNPKHYRHEYYKKTYPEGYELIWCDDARNHEGLMEAYKKNQTLPENTKGPGEPPKAEIKIEMSND